MNSNVRRPLYEGMQTIHAVWFDLALTGEAEARRRVLLHWTPGARLHLVQGGYLLMLAAPRFAHCAQLNGLALCEQAGVLSSAPLAADERAATPPSHLWLVRAAQAQSISLAAAPRIDAAQWLDLRAIVLLAPLQPPAPLSAAPGAAALLETTPVREIFSGKIAPPSVRREEFMQQLDQVRHGGKAALRGLGMALTVASLAAALLGAVPLGLIGLFGARTRGGQAGAGAARRPRPPSALARRLTALASRLAILTRASNIIGWRQALYLRKMMELLEKGDIGEALRHAIPLDATAQDSRPAFGAPRPRSRLDITGPGGRTVNIGLGAEMEQYLRSTYRRTFEKLDREGKIDEATYVLAELLKCGSEAVDYLESKGRIKQAAQLAETVELAPEIAVRLWCMEGNIKRAVQLARLGQAFAAAVQLLEKKRSAQAAELRLLWARDLAARGRLEEAAEAIWPLPDHQAQALAWLLEGEQAGGALGLRSLLRKLLLLPGSLADSEAAILHLLDDDSEHGAQQRVRAATQLLAMPAPSPAIRRVAAELARALVIDRVAERNNFDKKALEKLLSLSDGQVLQADLPPLDVATRKPPPGLTGRDAPLLVQLAERGLLTIHDARRLPDGHYLLALGEGGVIRIDRYGRQLEQFPVPATRLVLAAGGQRALALVARDKMWRISRIDLLARKVSDWIIQPLRFWANDYDGLLWNAVIDNRLVAIDTSRDQLTVSWQVADLPGRVVAFLEERGTQTLLLSTAEDIQQWRYQLPARRLMQRDSFPHPPAPVLALLPHSGRDAPTLLRMQGDGGQRSLQVHNGGGAAVTVDLGVIAAAPQITQAGQFLLVCSKPDEGADLACLVADGGTGKVLARLSLADADSARVHVDDGHILLCDTGGRLIDVRCEDSQVHTLTLA